MHGRTTSWLIYETWLNVQIINPIHEIMFTFLHIEIVSNTLSAMNIITNMIISYEYKMNGLL